MPAAYNKHEPSPTGTDTDLQSSYRPGRTEYTDTRIEIDNRTGPYTSPIDIAEREYRERFRPAYSTTVDASRPQYHTEDIRFNEHTVEGRPHLQSSVKEEVHFTEETAQPARFTRAEQKANMGYYDEDGMLNATSSISRT